MVPAPIRDQAARAGVVIFEPKGEKRDEDIG